MDVNLPVLEEGLRWRMCRAVRVDGKECAWAWPRVGWREGKEAAPLLRASVSASREVSRPQAEPAGP